MTTTRDHLTHDHPTHDHPTHDHLTHEGRSGSHEPSDPGHEPSDRGHVHDVAEHVRHHHAHLVAELEKLSTAFAEAVARDPEPERQRAALVRWIGEVLVPHALEEENGIYAAAGRLPEGRALIEAMSREHDLIRSMAAQVSSAPPLEAAVWGRALYATFVSHQAKENEIILPLLQEQDPLGLVEAVAHHH